MNKKNHYRILKDIISEKDNFILKTNNYKISKYGKDPYERDFKELLNKGLIIVDKHSGPTSHQVVDNLKKILKIKKAGHSGTLDPKVTGVLVCGLGKGTKLMEYLLKSEKEYVVLMYLHKDVSTNNLIKTMNKFKGKIKQKPPVLSSVKRVLREREIYELEILEIDRRFVLFRALVQHGTYIRKLCHDIGRSLGVGAHMIELRRTKTSGFSEENSICLTKLKDLIDLYNQLKDKEKKEKVENILREYIFPMEVGFKKIKKVFVKDSTIGRLSYGGDLAIPGVVKFQNNIEKGDTVAIFSLKREIVSVGISLLSSKEVEKKKKGFFVKTNKVFIDKGVYPIPWKE